MEEKGVAENDIILEITESILLENFDDINERLNFLQDRNIRIALDDFGKGYSSFYRLQELNVDILKIDRCFINRIQKVQNGEFITAEIISIAHKLGLLAVAEGVETEVQMDYLKRNRCDIIQGYLLSRPLPEEKAIERLGGGQ
jgi:EAL domain-containing protein (putative c-di-GMP-specific phosphodiesterase class I)